MKRILITGAQSYIGMSFEKWMRQFSDRYVVETLEMRGEAWKSFDFSEFDAVFHVAGIAHIKESKTNRELYYLVNRDLAIETAKKAKADAVKHFVFLSSMSVYGMSRGVITKATVPNPKSYYGKSKLQAEEGIKKLQDQNFSVAVLRPPMVYGKGCKGNYQRLSKCAQTLPFFPEVENQRSMLYIENLCEFVRLMIEHEEKGLFFPQNKDYVNTSEMVRLIAKAHGKRIRLTKGFNPLLKGMRNFVGVIDKVFGSLVYEEKLSEYKRCDQIVDNKNAIIKTEREIDE